MSLREKAQRLTMAGMTGEEEAKVEEGQSQTLEPGQSAVSRPAEDTARLEKAIAELERNSYRLAGMLDKAELERKNTQALAQDVEAQRVTAGKMLVELARATKAIPINIHNSVHSRLGASASAVTAAMEKSLAQALNQGVRDITNAAGNASAAASHMERARQTMGLRTVLLNLVAYPLFALLLLSLFVGVWPWNLRETNEDRNLISYGKTYLMIYPHLSERTKKELNDESRKIEAQQ